MLPSCLFVCSHFNLQSLSRNRRDCYQYEEDNAVSYEGEQENVRPNCALDEPESQTSIPAKSSTNRPATQGCGRRSSFESHPVLSPRSMGHPWRSNQFVGSFRRSAPTIAKALSLFDRSRTIYVECRSLCIDAYCSISLPPRQERRYRHTTFHSLQRESDSKSHKKRRNDTLP